jgi:glycerophosphoryl diester phosphodiesterase
MHEHPYLQWDGPIPFAHRGGTGHAPENSMAAFEHAVALGFRYLETDVHRSSDGVLAAFHDSNLLRTCGVDAEIADLTWNEIAELRIDEREQIPKMSDLLQRWPEHRFNIDCKSDDALPALIAMVEEFDLLDRICVGSFSLKRLRKLRSALGPRLLTALSPIEIGTLRFTGRLPGSHRRAAQVPPSSGRLTVVNDRFVRSAHRAGIPVHMWTINDEAETHRLLNLGVDGIMTDNVEMLRSVFDDRGLWRE